MSRLVWWRRLRGGRWEHVRNPYAESGGAFWWRRVQMFDQSSFRSGGACVIEREDHRR